VKSLKGALCLLMLDLDYFKSVNDNHGHVVGDRVLKQVAAALAGRGAIDVEKVGSEAEEILARVLERQDTGKEDTKLHAVIHGREIHYSVTESVKKVILYVYNSEA